MRYRSRGTTRAQQEVASGEERANADDVACVEQRNSPVTTGVLGHHVPYEGALLGSCRSDVVPF
ncbi:MULTISPECIES: hypothetical protein [Streptomyces]|uniref:hypothetical protein n=1 Tax=Streptomyces TaxID=1883 RepID=UPI001924B370|nr:hypothetical protein [Streptomyces spororaveus]